MKRFADLTEQEVLALAITNEEEDSRIYLGFAEGLRERFPSSAKVFEEMAAEEVRHRGMLYDLYRKKFGEFLPLVRRQDVRGFVGQRQDASKRGELLPNQAPPIPRAVEFFMMRGSFLA